METLSPLAREYLAAFDRYQLSTDAKETAMALELMRDCAHALAPNAERRNLSAPLFEAVTA